MRNRPSHWRTQRSLFRDKGKRSLVATWVIWALSIAAAVLLAGYWRHPDV